MDWDKGDTAAMPRLVPGTSIRIRPPWPKKTRPGKPGAGRFRVVAAPLPPRDDRDG